MSVSQDGMKNIIITVVLLAEDVGKVNVGLIIYGKIKPSNIFFGGNMFDNRTGLDELFADIETEKSGKTVEEYLDWVSNNNPEIDWGEDVGKEIIE